MVQEDRRKAFRRVSDECAQCGIWNLKINGFEDAMRDTEQKLDSKISWKVFCFILGLYLGLAIYNAYTIKTLAIDVGKVQTNVEALKDKVNDLKRVIYRK